MSLINVDYPNNTLGNQQANQKPTVADAQRATGYNLDLFELIKRKFRVINFFLILGVALSLVYYFQSPKLYTSTARIAVDEKVAPSMNGNESDGFTSEAPIDQYLVSLKSTKILKPAAELGEFDKLKTFEEAEDVVAYLRDSKTTYTVKPADIKSDSGYIKLTFEGPNPSECQKVLESIITSFEKHILSTTEIIGGESAELYAQWHENSDVKLRKVEEDIQGLVSRPELLTVEGRVVNPHQMQLTMMYSDLHELRRERTKAIARIETIKKDVAEGKNMDNLVVEMLRDSGDKSFGAYVATHDQYLELKVKEQDLLSQFGTDHPDLKNIRKQIEMVDRMRLQELSALRANKTTDGDADAIAKQDTIVADFLDSMKHKIDLMDAEEKSMQESITAEQTKSSTVAKLVERLGAKQRERERLESNINDIQARMSQIDAYKKHLWRTVQVADPPSKAQQSAPSLPISLAAGLFLGGLCGLVFAGLKDMAEKTFHSCDEVGELLDTRVIGHITQFPRLRPNKKSVPFAEVTPEIMTLHQPASQWSESYRAIRTAIFFQSQQSGAKIIQISSPVPGDGKSTTISNLAVSIAQSGRSVLLIDCDMRKPVQHKLFGLGNDVGISSVINGEAEPKDAVNVVLPEYLSIVTSGPIPVNPAELLTSARFAAILQHYSEQYDFVLVDTPPVLAVTDPSIVAGHVDMMLLVMKIRNGVRTDSYRAKEILDSTGVELGGIVINGLKRSDQKSYTYSGQYGYKTYGYVDQHPENTRRRS
ncbi:MAG: polysaccharide biosynthesis tyrosine autokinase [Planctomycetota bacterium]